MRIFRRWRLSANVLPGFHLGLGISTIWLGALVVLPLTALLLRPQSLGFSGFIAVLSDPRVQSALRLSFGMALAAAFIDTLLGALLAWVLVRMRLPGRAVLDGLIDLPLALPTAVAGITLTALYSPHGWVGQWLSQWGIKVAYTPLGIGLALVFVGLPFTVRAVEPVLRDLPREWEEAAATLGATPRIIARRVILPALAPAFLAGFALAFARAVGEYGSVIFIAGNLPLVSEIAPLLIVIKLQQFDYAGAACIGGLMLACAMLCLVAIAGVRRSLGGRNSL